MAVEIYKNAFTEDQATELLKLCGGRTKLITRSELRTQILKHFSELFNELNVERPGISVRYYYSSHPFALHSDGLSGRDGAVPVNYTLMAPLMWSPVASSTHTLFFEQFDETPNHTKMFYTRSGIKRFAGKKEIPTNFDYTKLTNLTDKPFDKEVYNRQLSYMDYNDFHGLSVHESVEWSVGDIIKFESNRLHCSADFGTDKLSTKVHLLFKIYIPE